MRRTQWKCRILQIVVRLCVASLLAACASAQTPGFTTLRISNQVLLPRVTRLGINLGEQNYYDSGIMIKNLLFRNPGFEGESYRTIFRCGQAAAHRCTDLRGGIQFPAGYWNGARYEVIDGVWSGHRGRVTSASAENGGFSLTLDDGAPVAPGDWIVAEKTTNSDPAAGWWPATGGGGSLTAEHADLSPGTAGKQALRLNASAPGAYAQVNAYLDSVEGMSFLQLRGRYRLSFRAKAALAGQKLHIHVARLAPGKPRYINLDLPLSAAWKQYDEDFFASESNLPPAPIEVSFRVESGSVLLDDASLMKVDGDPSNHTAFRDEVVETLRQLHPGLLRMMSSGAGLGSSMDNLLAPATARLRPGYRSWYVRSEDIPYGIGEFLELCQAVDAEPWITLPASTSREEARLLVEYLMGSTRTDGGARRTSAGHATPWTSTFQTIHLELGNETWNGVFSGETMDDPAVYGRRANQIFSSIRTAAGSEAGHLDLIVGTQAANAGRNQPLLSSAPQANSLALAPYLMFSVNDWSSDAKLYGPLLAEPEMSVREGVLHNAARSAAGRQLAIYEVNLHTTEGSAPAAVLDRLTPSAAAGITVTAFMLRMMREYGVRDQALFSLPQWEFKRRDGTPVKLWGSVVQMGANGRKRPQFLAEELANRAIHGDLVRVDVSGFQPTHDQPQGNDGVELRNVHEIDAYAFQNGRSHSLLVFNYGLEQSRHIHLEAPGLNGKAKLWRLVSPGPGATNESSEQVTIREESFSGTELELPPCSMAVLEWSE
ncbi:hypothetical protein ACOBR2_14210 [Telmatobacter bradus]|uniref:hypothetical protein n=1 Tax=Telmatobacter bradus TaxID=474953 RepID=UPI003B42B078